MTDFRALCAELLAHAKKAQKIAAQDLWFGDEDDGLFGRADTALVAPELQPVAEESSVAEPAALAEQPVAPTYEEVLAIAQDCDLLMDDGTTGFREDADLSSLVVSFARAVLARWGQP
jgi:hypothetical protein